MPVTLATRTRATERGSGMVSMDEIAAEALVNQLNSTNHWLSEIAGVLVSCA